jgi:hypothetical protein
VSIRPEAVRIEGDNQRTAASHSRRLKELIMKNYLLTVVQPDGPTPSPAVLDKIMQDVDALNQEMRAAGAWVFSAGLHDPSTATVLRPQGDDVLMIDGPFAEGKEHIGGLSIVKAADLDSALAWGRRLARATTLAIEVRPFQGELKD